MEFRLLGPLEVQDGDQLLLLGGRKQRALLALLILHVNAVVHRERLVDGLWGDAPPESAVKLVQLYVSQLRKLLPPGVLVTRPSGYALEVAADTVDLRRFERLADEASGAAPGRASELLREALGLWRGPALAEFADGRYFQVEAARLEETRLAVLEERFEAELALGRTRELVPELEATVNQWPLREGLRAQLMLALYRSGRQAEALEAYRAGREALAELGLEPGAQLRDLERRILTQDASLKTTQGAPLLAGRVLIPGPLAAEPAFPFVGRADELGLLHERLARAGAGAGGLVLLGGEAGSGKTRLVRELAHQAAASGALALYGTSDAAVTTPYQPLREWLEFLLQVADQAVLQECLGDAAEELARLVPEVGRMTGVSPSEYQRDPDNDRFALQTAVIGLLRRLSGHQPLLVVADDAQWADGETAHMLVRLARTIPHTRVLILIAFRNPSGEPGERFPERLTQFSRLEGTLRIGLDNLSGEEVGEFIRSVSEAPAASELVSAIKQLTEGTPLLLCELWRELRDSGGIEVGTTLRLTRPVAQINGPDSVRDLVAMRLARLDPETIQLLELAAVAGPQFDIRLLAVATNTELSEFGSALERALASAMIEELPAPSLAHRFTHELVRRAVYDRLSSLRRAQLHLQVAEATEQVHASEPERVLAELAYHFGLAAPIAGAERAIAYGLRAADTALLTSAALQDAAAHLARALELGIADELLRTRVQIDLGWLLAETGQVQPAAAVLKEALAAADALNEPGLAAYPAVFLARWDWIGLPRRPVPEMQATARRAIATFADVGDRRGLAIARHLLGYTYRMTARGAAGMAELQRALDDAEAAQHPPTRSLVISQVLQLLYLGPTPVNDAIIRCQHLRQAANGEAVLEAMIDRFHALFLAMATRFDEARETDRRASAVLDQLEDHTPVYYRVYGAETQRLLGDLAATEQHYVAVWERFTRAGPEGTPRLQASHAARDLADVYCDQHRWTEAADWLSKTTGSGIGTHSRVAVMARIAAQCGPPDDAVARASHAVLEWTVAQVDPGGEPVELIDPMDWRRQLRRLLAAAEHTDFLAWRARIWLAVAEVERADGHEAEAETAMTAAHALFEQKGNLAAAVAVRAVFDGVEPANAAH